RNQCDALHRRYSGAAHHFHDRRAACDGRCCGGPSDVQCGAAAASGSADLTLWLGDAPVSSSGLQAALDGISKGDRSQRVFLRADRSVPYGNLMEKMNALRTAGYLKVALVGLETESSR